MSQAQWNLCPENGAPHGRDCYFEEARTFDRIEGSIQEIIDDVPDGMWTIKIKRDFFHKVKGAVRIRDIVETQARQYTKIWIAMEAANASHTYEEGVLTVRAVLAVETVRRYRPAVGHDGLFACSPEFCVHQLTLQLWPQPTP